MNHHESSEHAISYGTYIIVWLALILLTGLTVVVAGLNLHTLTVATALTIASIKSLLVLFYFMHLKFEPPLFRHMTVIVVVALVVFIMLVFLDVLFR